MWKPNLLLIDDEACNNRVLAWQLNQHGFEVVSVSTAAAAWTKLEDSPYYYDLILLDRWLPDCDGIHFLEKLKQQPISQTLPVIMMTAHASKEAFIHAINAGVAEFIYKPINMDLLLFSIANALQIYKVKRVNAR